MRCKSEYLRAAILAAAFLILLLAGCRQEDYTPEIGPPPPEAVSLHRVASGLRRPVYLTHAGDSRLFVAEQRGKIRVIEHGEVLMEPFLDLGEHISIDGSERGLLGLAFHPNYIENGFFYVVYTNLDGDTDLVRYQVSEENANRADPASGAPILQILQPFGNHNGGQLAFGPDGYLYAGFGDGGALGDPEDNAQNPETLLGAILRLDIDGAFPYAVPKDNPYEGENGRLLETWQIGLRNPWAFSFDRATGALYVSDVGQEGPEELNFLPAGVSGINFGWPLREGESCYEAELCASEGLQAPILTYEHDEGCAIIGGYVYRGRQYPSLAGTYFFSDFCQGTLWSLRFTEDGWERTSVYEAETAVSSIGEDNSGELYILTYSSGEVWRIASAQE